MNKKKNAKKIVDVEVLKIISNQSSRQSELLTSNNVHQKVNLLDVFVRRTG